MSFIYDTPPINSAVYIATRSLILTLNLATTFSRSKAISD